MSAILFDANALIEILCANDVARLEVFGSTTRGEANENSDVDLLVEFSKRKSLGRRVDLLTEAAISPYLREQINRDRRVVYEAR